MSTLDIETSTLGAHSLEDYEPLIGTAATERIRNKATRLGALQVIHVSSTFYGGGVAEILTPLTLLMNAMGIESGWRMIQGNARFLCLHEETSQCIAGRTSRAIGTRKGNLRAGGVRERYPASP